jgi:hypothetical protein
MDYIKVLYIDPGMGGMLFIILFGLFGVAVFAFRSIIMKVKFRISGGKASAINDNKIPVAIYTDHKRYWNVLNLS